MTTRPAAVAGLFYPDNADDLREQLHNCLTRATSDDSEADKAQQPKALIVPHAGYIYSGQVAASAYVRLRPFRDRIHRVVLLGPCHRVPLRGLAVPSVDAFETPLGEVRLDHDAIGSISSLPQVQQLDLTHQHEHSLEVQLPFLQLVLNDFRIVPLVVGDTTAEAVRQVLEILWGGDETLIVVSSDLSHYHDYDSARAIDAMTCQAIEALDGRAIGYENACGRTPLVGLLEAACDKKLKVTTLDMRNSGDTAGSRHSVVGYGAWMLTP